MQSTKNYAAFGILSLFAINPTFAAPKGVDGATSPAMMQQSKEGTFIPFAATKGNEESVAKLLEGAAALVHETEPKTLQWVALREDASHFAIADFFETNEGRDAHFAGKVAASLKNASGTAVEEGWEKGVVAHVKNSKVVSYTVTTDKTQKASLAVRIDIEAKAGKAEDLEKFLSGAASLVNTTEPSTLLWYAVRLDATHFSIFDVFPDESAKSAHFAGKVAAALKASADELVQGGWDKGVLTHIKTYQVLSATY